MSLKKLGAALLIAAALSGVVAGSALAAAVTEDVKWRTGPSPGTELAGSETIGAEQVGTTTFTTEVAGAKYKLQSTGIECVECKIENSGGSALGSGKLKFKGLSVVEPAGCSVASEVTTKPLSLQADWMIGSTNYWKFTPTAGETTAFATFEITGCALATTLVPKGVLPVQSANPTTTFTVSIQVTASPSISATFGASLRHGSVTFDVSLTTNLKQTGVHAGISWSPW